MALLIKKNLVPSNRYSIKCPYTMTPTRIVVHNTANDASADNEIAYMLRNDLKKSFHYAVDNNHAVQGVLESRNSWNAGDGTYGIGNRQGIAIEICYSKSGGDKFIKAEQNAVSLIVDILKRYNWGIDKVTKHQDYSGKYCPHRTLDMGWERFINMIQIALNPPPVIVPRPFVEGSVVYPIVDVNLVETAGYADQTKLLIKKGTKCIVKKYHDKNGLYMALGDEYGVYFGSAWTKEFDKFSLKDPYMDEVKKLQEELKILSETFNAYMEDKQKEIEELNYQIEELNERHLENIKLLNEALGYKKYQAMYQDLVKDYNELKRECNKSLLEKFLEIFFPKKS